VELSQLPIDRTTLLDFHCLRAWMADRSPFLVMKRKRSTKRNAPEGAIWWSNLKMHPVNAQYGKELHAQRLLMHWSLEDLHRASAVAKSHLCGLEHGEHTPSLEVMMRLDAACRLPPDTLLHRSLDHLPRQEHHGRGTRSV
jgi:hypothetical protein